MRALDSVFVKHESCPQCGSRDNLGVFSDGHKWCFGCGYYVPATGHTLESLTTLVFRKEPPKKKLMLPEDVCYSYPKEASAWLANYDVFQLQAVKHKIMWSPSRQSLIFPIYEGKELVMYQERLFGSGAKTKYLTYGKLDGYLPVKQSSHSMRNLGIVIVVEDYISAMRVSERYDCMPLFGSHLSRETATRLSNCYHTLGIWLDFDKSKEAIKFAHEYEALFDNTFVVISDLDPKAYSTDTIEDYIIDSETELYDKC